MAWDQEEEKDQGVEERVIHFQIFKRGIIAGDSDHSRAWWGLAEMEWKSAAWREPGKKIRRLGLWHWCTAQQTPKSQGVGVSWGKVVSECSL